MDALLYLTHAPAKRVFSKWKASYDKVSLKNNEKGGLERRQEEYWLNPKQTVHVLLSDR